MCSQESKNCTFMQPFRRPRPDRWSDIPYEDEFYCWRCKNYYPWFFYPYEDIQDLVERVLGGNYSCCTNCIKELTIRFSLPSNIDVTSVEK